MSLGKIFWNLLQCDKQHKDFYVSEQEKDRQAFFSRVSVVSFLRVF